MIDELYHYATKNRMPLLYLEALKRCKQLFSLAEEYNRLSAKYIKVINAISKVSRVLERANVDYAFFKTIRPYREVTVDIDILVLGLGYRQAVKAMRHASYPFLGAGSLSATFYDIDANVNVDIYSEVGVSRLVYLDKVKLGRFIVDRKLPNGEVVSSLSQVADLICIIAHSVVKEQMYVLSEYYTTLYYLFEMNNANLSEFLRLTEECHSRSLVSTHLSVTALVHYFVHGFLPNKLAKLIDEFGLNNREILRVKKNCFLIPHKYHPFTFVEALVEKLGEQKARKSLACQVLNMLNLRFASSVFGEIFQHAVRESY